MLHMPPFSLSQTDNREWKNSENQKLVFVTVFTKLYCSVLAEVYARVKKNTLISLINLHVNKASNGVTEFKRRVSHYNYKPGL